MSEINLSSMEWPSIQRKKPINAPSVSSDRSSSPSFSSSGSPSSKGQSNHPLAQASSSPSSPTSHSQKKGSLTKIDSPHKSPMSNRTRKSEEDHQSNSNSNGVGYVRAINEFPAAYRSSPNSNSHSLLKKALNVNQNPSVWKRPSPSMNGRSLNAQNGSNPRFQYALANSEYNMGALWYQNDYYAHLNNEYEVTGVSPRNLVFSPFNSPGPSPGIRFRRIAEDFLDSINDDSPASQSRQLDQNTYAQQNIKQFNHGKAGSMSHHTLRNEDVESDKGPSLDNRNESMHSSFERKSSVHHTESTQKVDEHPTSDRQDPWQDLHDDIATFAVMCEDDSRKQLPLREELVEFTRRSIRCIWPTAEVDLVGSVAAQVALPKSDLDFVIYFKPSTETPPTITTGAPSVNVPSLPFIKVDAETLKPIRGDNSGGPDIELTPDTGSQSPSSSESGCPSSPSKSTCNGGSIASNTTISTPMSSSRTSYSSEVSNIDHTPTGKIDTPSTLLQYFAHASTLIKLIGGRKKSKVLFRSTKIQVFKDINLIRLRDGHSGISTDLWFPVDTAITARSQAHTSLVRSYRDTYPSFYPLACTLKSFMLQNLLNSGYSGLGSYGSLLMLVRYLQHERQQARIEKRSEEVNLGKLFVGFLRFYITFDYFNVAISVAGEGSFLDKKELTVAKKERMNRKLSSTTSDQETDEFEKDSNDFPCEDPPPTTIPTESTESSEPSVPNEQVAISENLTLIIQDPEDSSNHIICHHKALRNMLAAFMRALVILDPKTPLPDSPLVLTVPVAGSSSKLPFVASVFTSKQDPSNTLSGPKEIQKSAFHRLIDIDTARQGPLMKPCLSSKCTTVDSQGRTVSMTMCPIQNKVCFICGYMFVKSPEIKQKGSPSSTGGNSPLNQKLKDPSMQRTAFHPAAMPQPTNMRSYYRNDQAGRVPPRPGNRYGKGYAKANYYYGNMDPMSQYDSNVANSSSYMTILPYQYSDSYQMPMPMYNMSYIGSSPNNIPSPNYVQYVNPQYFPNGAINPSYGVSFPNYTVANYNQGIQTFSETPSYRNPQYNRPRPPLVNRDRDVQPPAPINPK